MDTEVWDIEPEESSEDEFQAPFLPIRMEHEASLNQNYFDRYEKLEQSKPPGPQKPKPRAQINNKMSIEEVLEIDPFGVLKMPSLEIDIGDLFKLPPEPKAKLTEHKGGTLRQDEQIGYFRMDLLDINRMKVEECVDKHECTRPYCQKYHYLGERRILGHLKLPKNPNM